MEEYEDVLTLEEVGIEPPLTSDEILGEYEAPLLNTPPSLKAESVPVSANALVDLDSILKRYGRQLTKEDIINDDDLMEVVRSSLEARFKPVGTVGGVYRGVSGLSGAAVGGTGPRNYRDMDAEEAFETWQNYQRSFAGGQSVTTANEVVYGLNADDEIRHRLGAGYYLFDNMTNAFTGEGSWSEMGDAIWDYGKAAVYDPTTLLSFGLGKAVSYAGTKASTAAARSMMIKGFQEYVKQGMSKTAARKAVGQVVAKAAPAATADAIINMGLDVAYQSQLIRTDVQEEYSAAQTALSAAGALVIPALVAGTTGIGALRKSDLLKDTFIGYKEIDVPNISAAQAVELNRRRTKGDVLVDYLSANFGKLEGSSGDFLDWERLKAQADGNIAWNKENMTDTEVLNAFFKRFWLGSVDGEVAGYYQALREAGFVVHKSMVDEYGLTGSFAQAIKFIKPEKITEITDAFEQSTGLKLNITKTPQGLADHFAKSSSLAGQTLWLPSQLSRLEKMGRADAITALKNMGATSKPADDPKTFQFGLSIYKRLLTSHLSTTGANIKGFTQLVSLNTAADFATAAINMTRAGVFKAFGDADSAAKYYNRAYGSALGAVRRGVSVLSPELEYEYAEKILNLNPKTQEKLFRDISGDSGVNQALKTFNLDPNNKIAAGMDSVTKGVQTATMVRLQDEITKTWAFGSNVNQAIMREYGVTPEKFFSRSDVAIEMASERFQTNVLEKATYRTLRETASVNWSTLPGNRGFRAAAKFVEKMTNQTLVGFLVPFGSFFNTTVATMADLSGANAMRFAYKRMTGQELDFVTQEGAEAFGRMAAGWSAVGLGIYGTGGSIDRIQQGLGWSQDRNDDGSIEDRTFDWPASTMRLVSQIIGHASGGSKNPQDWKFSEIPSDLWTELGIQLGGQSIRDLTDFERSFYEYVSALGEIKESQLVTGEFAGETVSKFVEFTEDLLLPPLGKAFQGATRPLDPVNQVVGLVTDANMTPDLRQGPERYNQAFKYINNLFSGLGSSSDLPRRATPTRGTDLETDVGKQIMGVRGSREPNLIETMLNAAGKPYWKSIRFEGPAEVKNYMDGLVAPYLNTAARKYLKQNPEFFKLPQADKERILNSVLEEARTNVTSVMQTGPIPRNLEMVRVLSGKDKDKVSNVMKFLGIQGDLEDILKEEDALSTLQKIDYFVKYYDRIFHGDLKLD